MYIFVLDMNMQQVQEHAHVHMIYHPKFLSFYNHKAKTIDV